MNLTRKQREALTLVAAFDDDQMSVVTTDATWADSYGAFVHWRTAQALVDRGLVRVDAGAIDMEEAGRELLRRLNG